MRLAIRLAGILVVLLVTVLIALTVALPRLVNANFLVFELHVKSAFSDASRETRAAYQRPYATATAL